MTRQEDSSRNNNYKKMPGEIETNRSNYLVVREAGDMIEVELVPPDDFRALQLKQMKLATRMFHRAFKSFDGHLDGEDSFHPSFVFARQKSPYLMPILNRLRNRLSSLFDTPLAPGAVEHLLQITPKERRRWMKDGRLPAAGRRQSDRSKTCFFIPIFSAQMIAELKRRPSIITEWRAQDSIADSNSR